MRATGRLSIRSAPGGSPTHDRATGRLSESHGGRRSEDRRRSEGALRVGQEPGISDNPDRTAPHRVSADAGRQPVDAQALQGLWRRCPPRDGGDRARLDARTRNCRDHQPYSAADRHSRLRMEQGHQRRNLRQCRSPGYQESVRLRPIQRQTEGGHCHVAQAG